VRGMFPSISEKQCRFEQADVSSAGGAAVKSLTGDGLFDLVHDCGLVDSVAMVLAWLCLCNSRKLWNPFCVLFCRFETLPCTISPRLLSAA
jgi:hypothetical protein